MASHLWPCPNSQLSTPPHSHPRSHCCLQVFDKQCVQAGGLCQINFLDPSAGGYGNTTSMLRGLALVRKNDPIVFMEVGDWACVGGAVLGLLYSVLTSCPLMHPVHGCR